MPATLERENTRAASLEKVAGLSRIQELDDLFRHYNTFLTRLCVRWTRGHRADAQDLLGEAYLRAVRAAEQSSLPDNLIAWVSQVIANLARDHLRAQNRATRSFARDSAFLETLCDPGCASETRVATRELLLKTVSNLRKLCPMQRDALLARSAGDDYETIAAQLSTSSANARKLVQTARVRLRAQLVPNELTLTARSENKWALSGLRRRR